MARRLKPKSTPSRRRATTAPVYATRSQIEAVLAIIEHNTKRIERLEDVFALQTRERVQVKQALGAIKGLLKGRTSARR